MKLTIDREAAAAYLEITQEHIVETRIMGAINIDLDEAGQVVGVEILHFRIEDIKTTGKREIEAEDEPVDPAEREHLARRVDAKLPVWLQKYDH